MLKVKMSRNVKKIISLTLSTIFLFNMIPGIVLFAFAAGQGEESQASTTTAAETAGPENEEKNSETETDSESGSERGLKLLSKSANEDYDTSWYDGKANPFEISDAKQLKGLEKLVSEGTNFSGQTINLKDSIDLLGNEISIGEEGKEFKGTFDGKGLSIINFNVKGGKNQGLFGYISGAKIQNLTIDYAEIEGTDNVGGIVGIATGSSTIANCEIGSSMHIFGSNKVGGIVGSTTGSVSNCANNKSAIEGKGNVGGVAGYTEGAIRGCTNKGEVSGIANGNAGQYIGGVVGYTKSSVSDCTNENSGIITGESGYVGGVAGYVGGSINGANKNFGIIEGDSGYVGGIAGYAGGSVNGINSAKIAGIHNVGGIVGSAGSSVSGENSGDVAGTGNEIGGIAGHAIGSVNGTNSAKIAGIHNVGGIVGSAGSSVSGENSGDVAGTGNNVGGIVGVDESSESVNGTNSGKVTGIHNVGGIAGYTKCSVSGKNSGEVIGTGNNVGGIVGVDEGSGSVNGMNSGKVTGIHNVGGIVGYTKVVVKDSTNSGEVVGTGNNIGGVAGSAEYSSSVSSTNYGKVTGYAYSVGGIVGWIKGATISNSSNKGTIIGTSKAIGVGGIVGHAETSNINGCNNSGYIESQGTGSGQNGDDAGFFVGGIVGRFICDSTSYKIENSANTGTVRSQRDNVAGIAGRMEYGTMTNCSNSGYIYARHSMGGIVGDARNSNLNTCTNSGNVKSFGANSGADQGKHVGGIVGYAYYVNINSSTNKGNVEGSNMVGGIAGYFEGQDASENYNKTYIISSCTNFGNVSGCSSPTKDTDENLATEYTAVGGIVGYGVSVRTEECNNEGTIRGERSIGGITGWTNNSTVISCTNGGEVRGWDDVGGIAGTFKGTSQSKNYLGRNKNTGSVYGNGNYGRIYGWKTDSHTHYYSNDDEGSKTKIKDKSDIWSNYTPVEEPPALPVSGSSTATLKSASPMNRTISSSPNSLKSSKSILSNPSSLLDKFKLNESSSSSERVLSEEEQEAKGFWTKVLEYIKDHFERLWNWIVEHVDQVKEYIRNHWDWMVENTGRIKEFLVNNWNIMAENAEQVKDFLRIRVAEIVQRD